MSETQSYLVNEVYPCLQGEGPNLGKPSVLVRFQICNLRCKWCDTPYTHTLKSDPVDEKLPLGPQKYKRFSATELLAKIIDYKNIRHVILSGGEPTLQNIAILASRLNQTHTIEVETNGTQIPHLLHHSFSLEHYQIMEWNVSPKGDNAGEKLEMNALRHWAELSRGGCKVNFKFVIREQSSMDDLSEVQTIIDAVNIPDERIILMAEGTDMKSQLSNTWLENICLTKGWRMSTRLHVLTHGHMRGV